MKKGGFDLKINRELAAFEQEFRAQGLPLDTFKNYLQKMKVLSASTLSAFPKLDVIGFIAISERCKIQNFVVSGQARAVVPLRAHRALWNVHHHRHGGSHARTRCAVSAEVHEQGDLGSYLPHRSLSDFSYSMIFEPFLLIFKSFMSNRSKSNKFCRSVASASPRTPQLC